MKEQQESTITVPDITTLFTTYAEAKSAINDRWHAWYRQDLTTEQYQEIAEAARVAESAFLDLLHDLIRKEEDERIRLASIQGILDNESAY